jgi:alkylated DNA repair dioxygenase AlkB
MPQPSLFLPEGLRYRPELISSGAERALVAELERMPLRPFQFHGYEALRRVAAFGWRYDYGERALQRAAELPAFLLPLREEAAAFAGLPAGELQHALVTEYAPGAGIGWHRDRPDFAEVIGISLLSPCVLRLRRRAGPRWERDAFTAEPRSAYLLSGPARSEWEHSIAPMKALRYSITFRRLKGA